MASAIQRSQGVAPVQTWGGYLATDDFEASVDPKRVSQLYQTENIIGQATWARIGDVGPIPQLSAEEAARLEAPCPIWPERRLIDTHLLIWIPSSVTKMVNGRVETMPVTLRNLPNLIPGAKYCCLSDPVLAQHGDKSAQGRWLLVPKELFLGSRNQSIEQQRNLVAQQRREMPHAVEMAVALFMKEFLSAGTYLLGCDPGSYTRCAETMPHEGGAIPLTVGGFSASGLEVLSFYLIHEDFGVLGSEVLDLK